MKKRIPARRRKPQPKYRHKKNKKKIYNLDPSEVKEKEQYINEQSTARYVHTIKKDRQKFASKQQILKRNINNNMLKKCGKSRPLVVKAKKPNKKKTKNNVEDEEMDIFKTKPVHFKEVVSAPPKLNFPKFKANKNK